MDSQPSGNNKELIFIETDEIYFTIINFPFIFTFIHFLTIKLNALI